MDAIRQDIALPTPSQTTRGRAQTAYSDCRIFAFVDGATIRIYLMELRCNSGVLQAEPPFGEGGFAKGLSSRLGLLLF
jgi:hypothetical protein